MQRFYHKKLCIGKNDKVHFCGTENYIKSIRIYRIFSTLSSNASGIPLESKHGESLFYTGDVRKFNFEVKR